MINYDPYQVWKYLINRIGNPYGVAAIMGNLMAESSMSSICATGLNKIGYASVGQYTKDSDDGEHDFVNDGVAYGLAQWCFYSRKQGLLDLARKKNKSVGDSDIQLEYLCDEMQGYKTVWNAVVSATNIKDASDIVMLKYEKPANTGDGAKRKRAEYAQKYYDLYAWQKTSGKLVVITDNKVNLRCGNDKHYTIHARANKGDSFKWVATAQNGWHAIEYDNRPQRVLWVHPDFSEVRG